jgi:hypothetical protein
MKNIEREIERLTLATWDWPVTFGEGYIADCYEVIEDLPTHLQPAAFAYFDYTERCFEDALEAMLCARDCERACQPAEAERYIERARRIESELYQPTVRDAA